MGRWCNLEITEAYSLRVGHTIVFIPQFPIALLLDMPAYSSLSLQYSLTKGTAINPFRWVGINAELQRRRWYAK